MAPAQHRLLRISWLLLLRWASLVGLLVLLVLSVADLVVMASPWALLLGLGATSLPTLALALWDRRRPPVPDTALAAVLSLDVLVVTGLLGVSGGAANSLSILFLFPVLVAALGTAPGWAALVLGLAAFGYGSLFFWAPANLHAHGPEAMQRHILGMYIGFLLTGTVTLVAVARVRRSWMEAQRVTQEAQELEANTLRLTGLATLAAGAAHELRTPLATILLVAGELRYRLDDPRDREDVALIREEVARCQEVLVQLTADAAPSDRFQEVQLAHCLEQTLGALMPAVRSRIRVSAPDLRVELPTGRLGSVLRRLVGNAIDASPAEAEVLVQARVEEENIVFEVIDVGEGMSAETRRRALEPFFTTKTQGRGRGLGLTYAYAVVRQLNGDLALDENKPRGTIARISLPLGSGPSEPSG